jgi:hypothetical protein
MATPIENKKNEKNDKLNEEKSDWTKFGFSVLNNFFHTALIAILGSNFIFFSTLNNLEYFFPTKNSAYFDTTKILDKIQKHKQPQITPPLNKEVNHKLLNKLGIGDVKGWPYNLYKKELFPSLSQGFLNWFSSSTADSYMTQRKLQQSLFSFFSPEMDGDEDKNLFSSQPLQFLLAPFIKLFGLFIVPVLAFVVTFFKLFTNKRGGFLYAFIGLFFAYTWIITFSLATLQTAQFILTLMFVPLLSNYKEVLKIIYNNRGFIGFLFGAFVVMSAFNSLETIYAIVGLVVYILLLVSYLFSK